MKKICPNQKGCSTDLTHDGDIIIYKFYLYENQALMNILHLIFVTGISVAGVMCMD